MNVWSGLSDDDVGRAFINPLNEYLITLETPKFNYLLDPSRILANDILFVIFSTILKLQPRKH